MLLLVFALCAAGVQAAELTSGDVVLLLTDGAKWPGAVAQPGRPEDMQLDFASKDGVLQKEVWGFAPGFNCANHLGQLTAFEQKDGALRATVRFELAEDISTPGGEAEYQVEAKRNGNEYVGSYTGKLLDAPLKGQVRGFVRASHVRPAADFKPLSEGEHPRLIFRKQDLSELKRRMALPEGKALLAMLETAPIRTIDQVDDRRSSWLAANHGMVWQLTGNKQAAEDARRILVDEVVRKPVPIDRADIHLGSRLLGIALAYDLCYDAWDEGFRAQTAEYLYYYMLGLWRGRNQGLPMEDIRAEQWSYRNVVRMSAVGVTALALIGEKGAKGAMDAQSRRVAQVALRDVLRYLETAIGPSGACVEGDFYKKFALANGLLQFMHAARLALGLDLSHANPNLLAGYVISADPIKHNSSGVGVRAVQVSGIWPMGFGVMPAEALPYMKWCFDREAGAGGAKHFDITYPLQVGYALMNYPFAVPARPPGEGVPWTAADQEKGRFVFRNAWKDNQDILAVVSLRNGAWPGILRTHVGKAFEVQITGLGRKWLSGAIGVAEKNLQFGAELVSYAEPHPQQAVINARFDRVFMVPGRAPAPKKRASAKEEEEKPVYPWGQDGYLEDLKTKVQRSFGVDLSGACGAPALFVVVDRVENPGRRDSYDLGVRDTVFKGNAFGVGEADGPSLKGVVVCPAGAKAERWTPGGEHFTVFTIQNGAPPPIKVEGAGLKAQVTVGGQTVSFDGEKVVFGK